MVRSLALPSAILVLLFCGSVSRTHDCVADASGQCPPEPCLGDECVADMDVSLLQTRVNLEASVATTAEYFQADGETNCDSAYMIITSAQCELAADELGYAYTGEVDKSTKTAGCYWVKVGLVAYFNADLEGVGTSTKAGGICAYTPATTTTTTTTTTTLAYFKAAGAANCDAAYMITLAEECDTAAVALGYTYEEAVDKSSKPAGCYWVKNGVLANFNANLDGVGTSTGSGGICALVPATTTTTTTTTTTVSTTSWQSPFFMMTCSGTQIQTTTSMTYAQYDAAVASVTALYNTLSDTCNGTYCPQADFAGCVLRVAGHDFMDYADGEGGSDGCLDMDDTDNAGLAECISTGEHGVSIADAYKDHCTTISLADFFVISAEAVMNLSRQIVVDDDATRETIDFRSQFMYGRTTSLSCDWSEGRLPNPENSCSAVNVTFVQRMGLSWDYSAALMGVHSLGRAEVKYSGYNGWWSDAENSRRFNNNYFISMVAKGWGPEVNVSGNTGKNQWERIDSGVDEEANGKEMMLNTDLCLYYTMDDDGAIELDSATAAANDCLCTWPSAVSISSGTDAYNGGVFCGNTTLPDGFGDKRTLCCGSDFEGDDDDKISWIDCGLPESPMGPAATAIRSYINQESKWLSAFLKAWKVATTNGFSLSKIKS